MAAAKCNISFDINYTSSIPITSATASYKISGSSDPDTNFSIPLAVPYSGSSFSVILPDIQTIGNYDLTVTLTTADGVVTKNEANAFKIGNCSGNKPPTVLLRWDDNLGTEDRVCNTSVCNFTIEDYATDPDNDIVSNQIFKRIDNGAWSLFIANVTQSTFTDSINTIGTQSYKAVVIDANNNTVTSNILSYTKPQGIGKFYRKAINGISCEGRGDGPTNYDVWCTGTEDFSLSDSNLTNISAGFIRLVTDAGTSEIGLSKSGGGALLINEVLPINSIITVSYAATGQNPPSAYPTGYPANVSSAVYRFEYSGNGTTGWTPFDFSIDD
ncbi:MAG: hypothetical protein EOO19_09530 [Chryseobacterium sp.]|nr:MAG: hypothetical protein EOO19_09530 [Chryseobacterium sp.]